MIFSPIVLDLLTDKCGADLTAPAGAEVLCFDIERVTGQQLGVNTVKRLSRAIRMPSIRCSSGGARDRLYIEDFTIQPGTTLDVPIVLDNDTVYSAMQTDLYLPEGLEVETDYGEYWIDPTSRLSNNHFISSYRQPDGAIRIFVSSQSVRLFTGNSGPLVTVRIRAAASFAGRKTVSLRRSVLVEENGDRHTPDDSTAQATAEGSAVVTGDVTGDGRVDIADVNAVINMMLGKATQTATGDVSGDGLVDIADVNRIINIMLGKN